MTRDEIINLYKEKMESNAMSLRDVAKKVDLSYSHLYKVLAKELPMTNKSKKKLEEGLDKLDINIEQTEHRINLAKQLLVSIVDEMSREDKAKMLDKIIKTVE